MTALQRIPENTNLLQSTKFLLTIDRLPATQFFCQQANIPGLILGQAMVNTPLVDYYSVGNKISYNTFNITFLLDEKLESWRNLHDWFRSIADPTSFDVRNSLSKQQNPARNTKLQQYSDASLTLLSNLNNPLLRVNFINMFPISISDIQLSTQESADTVLTADASFIFMYHEFVSA